ncbi:MAG: hypothetical protein QXV35_05370 [Archaeoglobaceae archaeon]
MTPTTTTLNRKRSISGKIKKRRAEKAFDFEPKLYKFDKHGKIYVPSLFRRLFHGYRFAVYVESGKIILDPVKVEGGSHEDRKY